MNHIMCEGSISEALHHGLKRERAGPDSVGNASIQKRPSGSVRALCKAKHAVQLLEVEVEGKDCTDRFLASLDHSSQMILRLVRRE